MESLLSNKQNSVIYPKVPQIRVFGCNDPDALSDEVEKSRHTHRNRMLPAFGPFPKSNVRADVPLLEDLNQQENVRPRWPAVKADSNN